MARLTGLDRTGVEVACAVRPGGHVLQVANGKGRTFAAARRSAVGEAAELWASERVVPEELIYGTPAGLRARGHDVWLGDLGSAGVCMRPELWTDSTLGAFRLGRDLLRGGRLLIPAPAVHCPPPGAPFIGPCAWRWTTNGLGAAPTFRRALRHALFEALERDELARALPQGWTEKALRDRALSPARWPPRLSALRDRFTRAGLELVLCDLTPERGVTLPLLGALLFDRERGPQPVSAGYACRCSPEGAAEAAAQEAAQARLTDIHGGRDDIAPMAAGDVAQMFGWARGLRPRRSFGARGRELGLAGLVTRIARAGHRRLAVVTLSPPEAPLVVVKVVIPSFSISDLL